MYHFQELPQKVIDKIFDNLTFSEIVKLRLVGRWFNKECTRILNKTFLSLKSSLDCLIAVVVNEIENLHFDTTDSEYEIQQISCACSCYKIYHILKSELSALYAVCGRYVHLGLYCFAGGRLLDYFRKAMSIPSNLVYDMDRPLQAYASITMRLFLLNEEFMDHFETVIEPLIMKQYSVSVCHGTKLIDLLDSYIYSNYHIEATFNGSTCQISGRYEILDTHSISPPIRIPNNIATSDDMKNLMRYFRNEVRWNNYLYALDSAYTACLVNKKAERKRGKFCLNSNEELEILDNQKAWADENGETPENVFDKTFSRRIGNPSENENVSYFIELECSKYCAPMRLTPYILEASRRKDQRLKVYENRTFSEMMQHISMYYEFSMGLKVILSSPSDRNWNTSTENSLNLYTDGDLCVVFQNTRELPL